MHAIMRTPASSVAASGSPFRASPIYEWSSSTQSCQWKLPLFSNRLCYAALDAAKFLHSVSYFDLAQSMERRFQEAPMNQNSQGTADSGSVCSLVGERLEALIRSTWQQDESRCLGSAVAWNSPFLVAGWRCRANRESQTCRRQARSSRVAGMCCFMWRSWLYWPKLQITSRSFHYSCGGEESDIRLIPGQRSTAVTSASATGATVR